MSKTNHWSHLVRSEMQSSLGTCLVTHILIRIHLNSSFLLCLHRAEFTLIFFFFFALLLCGWIQTRWRDMRECYVEKFNLRNRSSSDDDVQRILALGDSDALIEFQNFRIFLSSLFSSTTDEHHWSFVRSHSFFTISESLTSCLATSWLVTTPIINTSPHSILNYQTHLASLLIYILLRHLAPT